MCPSFPKLEGFCFAPCKKQKDCADKPKIPRNCEEPCHFAQASLIRHIFREGGEDKIIMII